MDLVRCFHWQGCSRLVTVCITAGREDLHSAAGWAPFGIGHKEEVCIDRTDFEDLGLEVRQVRGVEKLQCGTGLAWYFSAPCRCPWANEQVTRGLWSVCGPFRYLPGSS